MFPKLCALLALFYLLLTLTFFSQMQGLFIYFRCITPHQLIKLLLLDFVGFKANEYFNLGITYVEKAKLVPRDNPPVDTNKAFFQSKNDFFKKKGEARKVPRQ